jgi:hypothetical protein
MPCQADKALFIERAYTVRVDDKVIDNTIYKAAPSYDGYTVTSKGKMNYKNIDADVEMKWYFDKGLKCNSMEVTVPFMGTQAYNGCYSYPTGIVCSEILNDMYYNGTTEYAVGGKKYIVDVYVYEGFELGIGRDIPLLFYEHSKDKNISVELYFIK